MPKNTLANRLLQHVRNHPGVTGSEIQNHFKGEAKPRVITGTLVKWRRMGLIENRGSYGASSRWYPLNVDPIDPMFVSISSDLLQELKTISPDERANYLARRLQEIF